MKLVLQWPKNGPLCEYSQGQLLADFRSGKLPADCTVRWADGCEWVSLRHLFANESPLPTLSHLAPRKLSTLRPTVAQRAAWLLRPQPVVLGAIGGLWAAAGILYLIALVDRPENSPSIARDDFLEIAFQMSVAGWTVAGGVAGPWFLSVLKPVFVHRWRAIALAVAVNFVAIFAALHLLDDPIAAFAACLLPVLLFNRRAIVVLDHVFQHPSPREWLRRLPLHRLKPYLDTPEGRRLTRILRFLRSNGILQTRLLGLSIPGMWVRWYLLGSSPSFYLLILICFLTPFPLSFHRRGKVTFLPALLITLPLLVSLRLGMPPTTEYWNYCFEDWWQSGQFWGEDYVIPIAAAFLGCSAGSATYQLVDRLRRRDTPPTDGTLAISAIGYLAFFLPVNLSLVGTAVAASRWLEANKLPPFQDGLYHMFGLFPPPPDWVYRLLVSPIGLDYVIS